jgi:spore germination cell wall hydrolase CwlJ-like protein
MLSEEQFQDLYKKVMDLDNQSQMALTLVGEVFNQPVEGKIGVANCIRNRKKHWKRTYESVMLSYVKKGNRKIFQFSCWEDKLDYLYGIWAGSVVLNNYEKSLLREIYWIVDGVIGERITDNIGHADHYYAWRIVRPRWAMKMKKTRTIQDHVFYRSDRVK